VDECKPLVGGWSGLPALSAHDHLRDTRERQGLPLVPISAQLELSLSPYNPTQPMDVSRRCSSWSVRVSPWRPLVHISAQLELPLSPYNPKVLKLSSVIHECKALGSGVRSGGMSGGRDTGNTWKVWTRSAVEPSAVAAVAAAGAAGSAVEVGRCRFTPG
jgi:hypothetical protein